MGGDEVVAILWQGGMQAAAADGRRFMRERGSQRQLHGAAAAEPTWASMLPLDSAGARLAKRTLLLWDRDGRRSAPPAPSSQPLAAGCADAAASTASEPRAAEASSGSSMLSAVREAVRPELRSDRLLGELAAGDIRELLPALASAGTCFCRGLVGWP